MRALLPLALVLCLCEPAAALTFSRGPFAGTVASPGVRSRPDLPGADVSFPSIGAGGSAPWVAGPLTYTVSEITFTFDDFLPLVWLSGFTVEISALETTSSVLVGLSRSFDFTASLPALSADLDWGNPSGFGYHIQPNGSIEIGGSTSGSYAPAYELSFGTPFGTQVTNGGGVRASLTFGSADVLQAPLSLIIWLNVGGVVFYPTDPLSGLPLTVYLYEPVPIHLGELNPVPEPGTGALLASAVAALRSLRRRARPSAKRRGFRA